jgi:outer membrane biosynthesis protein TonB
VERLKEDHRHSAGGDWRRDLTARLVESSTAYVLKSGSAWRILRLGSRPFEPPRSDASAPLRVRASIREPRKIADAKPHYPEAAKGSRIQGTVILECIIDTDGAVVVVGEEPIAVVADLGSEP